MPNLRAVTVAAIALLASCRGGCARPDANNPLSLLPATAERFLVVDVAKLRSAPVIAEIANQKPDAGHLIVDEDGRVARAGSQILAGADSFLGGLAKKSGFDPVHDIDSVVVASAGNELGAGAVVRGRHLEPTRLFAFLRAMEAEGGQEQQPKSTRRGSRIVWSLGDRGEAAIFLDDKTMLIGTESWAERMADLADGVGRSAASSAELVNLYRGISGHAIGGVMPSPSLLGMLLQSQESLKAALDAHQGGDLGGLKFRRAIWTVDAAQRLTAHVNAELANPGDASALARQVDEQKQSVGLLKLGGFIRARAEGATLRLDVDLDAEHLRTLVTSVAPFLLTGFARD